MQSYVTEIELLLTDVKGLDTSQVKCFEDFDRENLPKVVKDQRKQRKVKQDKNPNNLKRPPMIGLNKPG